MAALASRSSGHEDQGISPELMIVIAGLFVVFLVIIIVFALPAKNSNNTGRPIAFDGRRAQCSHEFCHPRLPTLRRGLALPVASLPRCPAYHQHAHRTSEKAWRASQESMDRPSLAPPTHNVNTRRHAPTGGSLPRLPSSESQPRHSSSTVGVPSSPMAQITATSTSPPPAGRQSIGYGARGPTATLRPLVW
ncbi:hypothetical protein GSI_02878 [Ganoderma sinense ZZ0214-1]|uniref:Uncharacterized protein n=1 Tax=Ganoderma sinense ZZ0214-1 TaxID=1077348 RepID=A0A2G8SMV6_9APHY|nr:hypothetical protein GSI_02878 [Ganoderma sinense ZZ0214-1]